jgi:hypothetical protein
LRRFPLRAQPAPHHEAYTFIYELYDGMSADFLLISFSVLPLLGLLFVFAIAVFIHQRRQIVVRRWFPAFVLIVTLIGFPKTVLLPAFRLAESLAPSTGGPQHFSPSIAKLFDFIAFGAPFCLWLGLPIGVNLLKGVRFSSAGVYRFAYLPFVALLIGLSAATQ